MTYRSILVQAEPGDHGAARLACAADLANRFEAEILGIGAQALPPLGFGEIDNPFAADWLQALADQTEVDLKSAEENFRRVTTIRHGQWRTERVMPAQALVGAARAADLIVAGGSTAGDRGPYNSADVGSLVLTCGRPVLVAPPTGDYCRGQKVLVAWKDSREARRATADALPFLARADEVLVLEICPPAAFQDAQERTVEVAAWLSRHGVPARGEAEIDDGEHAADDVLVERATWLGADLIVAGGYGHTRLGEQLFGGVTRRLLAQQQLFVLFSH